MSRKSEQIKLMRIVNKDRNSSITCTRKLLLLLSLMGVQAVDRDWIGRSARMYCYRIGTPRKYSFSDIAKPMKSVMKLAEMLNKLSVISDTREQRDLLKLRYFAERHL